MLAVLNAPNLLSEYITPERISLVVRVALIILIGIPVIRLIRNVVRKLTKERLSAQSGQLLVRNSILCLHFDHVDKHT